MNLVCQFSTIALLLGSILCFAQDSPLSNPQALTLVAKSMAALTGGGSATSVTLNANAILIAGSDYFVGTATLQANGPHDSRVDLNLDKESRTEIRTGSSGNPSGSWLVGSDSPQAYPSYNCWTDAAWFFPALSSLSQSANPVFFFSYVGQEKRQGVSVEHIRAFQHLAIAPKTVSEVDQLSAIDIYLDSTSFLPLAMAFKLHSDNDMNIDVPMEVRFANYQLVSGVQVPFHIQRLLNGSLWLDLTTTSAVLNSTVPASLTSGQ